MYIIFAVVCYVEIAIIFSLASIPAYFIIKLLSVMNKCPADMAIPADSGSDASFKENEMIMFFTVSILVFVVYVRVQDHLLGTSFWISCQVVVLW